MSETASTQPSGELLASFRNGDPVAIADVIDLVLPQLAKWAFNRYPVLPNDDVLDTVYQVLTEISLHPDRYDPARSVFTTYAFNLIQLRLKDVYEKWKKISENEELGPAAHEKLLMLPYKENDDASNVDVLLTRDEFFQYAEQYLTDVERDICRIMRESDDPGAIAEALARHGDVSEVRNARAKLRRKLASIAAKSNFSVEDML